MYRRNVAAEKQDAGKSVKVVEDTKRDISHEKDNFMDGWKTTVLVCKST